jgi:hypothetical protein
MHELKRLAEVAEQQANKRKAQQQIQQETLHLKNSLDAP